MPFRERPPLVWIFDFRTPNDETGMTRSVQQLLKRFEYLGRAKGTVMRFTRQ